MNGNQFQSHDRPEFGGPICYGELKLDTRYSLSPLAGFTTLPFRRIVRRIGGVGLATTDLVNARALLAGGDRTMQMVETCDEDRPFAVQIFGADPNVMKEAAILLEGRGVDSIDINMGCPVARITNGGAGSSMMRRTDETTGLVQSIVEAVSIPVTVKMRLGWDDSQITAPMFARLFEQVGVAAVAIHGRTREQGFSGTVNRDGIRQVVEAVENIPVIANGDIRSVPDAAKMFAATGCRAISVGRGALANPWIFRQLQEWEETGSWSPAGSFDDRMELLKTQFGYLEERHGSERAIILFRKMGHWYLKGMRVRKRLRGDFQSVKTRAHFDEMLATVSEEGPVDGNRSGILTDAHVPVPAGPNARW